MGDAARLPGRYSESIESSQRDSCAEAKREDVQCAWVHYYFGTLIAFGLHWFSAVPTTFLKVFCYIFIIAMSWNVIDLLVMDWLVICRITPKWVVIQGTEGCRGYHDYWYHFKGFLIGCVYTTILSLAIAGIDYAILHYVFWK